MRYTAVALIGAVALSAAACGSSGNPTPTASGTSSSSNSTPASKPANGKDRVAGLIASVSGNAIQVTQQNGTATVDFANSTKISEIGPAQISDVTAGSCITVRPTRDSPAGGPITARSVLVSQTSTGTCAAPQGGQQNRGVRGTVDSVGGNSISITAGGNTAQTNVAVNGDTVYAKRTPAVAEAIAQGRCVTAGGSKDTSGTLQATAITVRPAGNRPCPGPRR